MPGQPIASMSDLIAAVYLGDSPKLYKAGQSANEAAGVWVSYLDRTGTPGAVAKPSVGINGAVQSKAIAGYLPYRTPTGGRKKYLASLTYACSQGATIQLVDVLWHNWSSVNGISPTTLTEQAIVTPAWPARDANGETVGEGLELWMGVLTTATTNAGAVGGITARYTNSEGVGNRTASLVSWPATAVAGTMQPLALQSGDIGIESIEGITLGTTLGAGELFLMVTRPIVTLGVTAANIGMSANVADLGLPQIFDDSALAPIVLVTSTTGAVVNMNMRMAEW